jgi:3-oxoadipate enol-lactonase
VVVHARRGGVGLAWESTGRGPAVLLVMGFGATRQSSRRTVRVLGRRFRVLIFDNRGVGDSDLSPGPPAEAPEGPRMPAARVSDAAPALPAMSSARRDTRSGTFGLQVGGCTAPGLSRPALRPVWRSCGPAVAIV